MTATQDASVATRFSWLTPARCRIALLMWVIACAIVNIIYLNRFCPIDLSGDEAQYWDWSRRLALSYYSKGPLVAYIIRASCAICRAETMHAVRYPAILLNAGTTIFTYLLTLKLFKRDRLALGATLFSALVPIFIFGSIFMTIDAPLFFCWAAATYFAAVALFDEKRSAWIWVGVFSGLGFLAKYAMFAWLPSLFGYVLTDALSRKRHTRGAIFATIVALLFTLPVIVWNQQHGWVSAKHVAHQTGTAGGAISHGNFFELILSQIALLDPIIAIVVVASVIYTIRSRASVEPNRRQLFLLVWVGLPLFLMTVVSSFLAKAQANWPAPAYFSLVILAAYFLSTRLRSWSGWIMASIVVGVITFPMARDPSLVFPIVRAVDAHLPAKRQINPGPMLSKIVGWQLLGRSVDQQLSTMPPDTFILCDDYMQTAETAFYCAGHPKTYCAGPYLLSDPKRLTQYDMWKDRSLTPLVDGAPNPLIGRDCIYVGKGGEIPPEIPAAFEQIEKLQPIPVIVRGFEVKTFKLWRCHGFKGMRMSSGEQAF